MKGFCYLLVFCFCASLLVLAAVSAYGHDAGMATSPEQARVYEMYRRWMRPQGDFNGVQHRKLSCCNKTDCGLVLESKREHGKLYVRPELYPNGWFWVPESVMEVNQPDPVESPDGRAHVCIIAGQVACYTAGDGA